MTMNLRVLKTFNPEFWASSDVDVSEIKTSEIDIMTITKSNVFQGSCR